MYLGEFVSPCGWDWWWSDEKWDTLRRPLAAVRERGPVRKSDDMSGLTGFWGQQLELGGETLEMPVSRSRRW